MRLNLPPVTLTGGLLQFGREGNLEQMGEIQNHVPKARAAHSHAHLHAVGKHHAVFRLQWGIRDHPGNYFTPIVLYELIQFVHARIGIFVPFYVGLIPCLAALRFSTPQKFLS